MIQVHPSLVSPPLSHDTGLIHSGSVPSFCLETVSQTILKLTNPSFLSQSADVPAASPQTVEAMQQLIGIINTLHLASSPPAETPASEHFPSPLSPETLAPYVSEEAYEVLEALRQEALRQEAEGGRQRAGRRRGDVETRRRGDAKTRRRGEFFNSKFKIQNSKFPSLLTPYLISIQALIPYLLWSIARSSYTVMQLIEGISVQQLQADSIWMPGMVRLVVMLAVRAPEVDWCFDLATGCPSESLLDENVVLRSDDNLLPIWRSPTFTSSNEGDRIENQLQELLRQIQATNPSIKPLLEGICVELLQPGQSWQIGEIQLKLGLEFIAQESEFTAYPSTFAQFDLVEAELLEDNAIAETYFKGSIPAAPISQVSVVELPRQPLRATTLVCLRDSKSLDYFSSTVVQQQILAAIADLQQNQALSDSDESMLQVVSRAYEIVYRTDHASSSSIYLHQPVLLMAELMPKLLWQITRSSYQVMQLIGGIEASILQPGFHWQQGTLRVLAALWFQAPGSDFMIDLTTGRSIIPESMFLHPDTVCQSQTAPGTTSPFPSLLSEQPTQVKILITSVQQQLQAATPELQLLIGKTQVDKTQVKWLEDGEDWKQGTLRLELGLEFIV